MKWICTTRKRRFNLFPTKLHPGFGACCGTGRLVVQVTPGVMGNGPSSQLQMAVDETS